MRLMIAGGGGFRVPLVYRALCTAPFAGLVDEVVLYDVDPLRSAAISAVLRDLPGAGSGPRVMVSGDPAEALTGTDVVFAAIRPGGTAGRVADERIALDLGVLGQETTGAGGISYALRTIPPMLELARAMRRHCPEAWLINFTNPAGMVTEALVPVLGRKVIGICDSASGLVQRAARAAGVSLSTDVLDGVGYYGLNHLGWLYRLAISGRDALPGLLADDDALAGFEEGRLFGKDMLRRLACVPNEYLYYYYNTARATAAIQTARETRGQSIHVQQSGLYARLAAASDGGAYALWEAARRSREEGYLAESRTRGEERDEDELAGGGYETVALALMRALTGGGPAQLILNVPNSPVADPGNAEVALPGLPGDAVVEVPCAVTPDGALPLPQARPGSQFLTLMRRVKEVEQLTIRAAGTGDRQSALRAFTEHPLVGSAGTAVRLLEGYEAAFPELARLWLRGPGT